MLKAEPDESQNGNKTAGRNTDNLRYAVDAMLMAECKEELKRLLMRVKERVSGNSDLTNNAVWQKNKS